LDILTIRILLVEDNLGDARLIREALSESEKISSKIDHVTSFKEFESSFKKKKYDLVILDLTLPDATGLETVRRTITVAPETAIIVLSGLNDEDIAIKAVQEGAQDYLVKGQADLRVLERVILYAIERNLARIRISALKNNLESALCKINEELSISAKIQRRIIQDKVPVEWSEKTSIYYSFTNEIGGDIFDIIDLNPDKTVFIVADGSGHSIHNAFLSIMFKLSLQHHINKVTGPKELIQNINEELQPYFLEYMFFTAFIAWINTNKMTLTYSSAGHPAQFLLSPKRKKIFRLKNIGIPLCINFDIDYEETSIDIVKGDKLLLLTDGIYECSDNCGERFGENKVQNILNESMDISAEQIMEKIMKQIYLHNKNSLVESEKNMKKTPMKKALYNLTKSYKGGKLQINSGHLDDAILLVTEL